MRRVFKYPVSAESSFSLTLPRGASLLTVQMQRGGIGGFRPVIWALVDETAPPERREFAVYGTGHAVRDGLRYVGTFQDNGFVGHLFETPASGEPLEFPQPAPTKTF